jgi:hypothetical protein
MGLKIVCPVEYQRVKKVSLTAMPLRGGVNSQFLINLLMTPKLVPL